MTATTRRLVTVDDAYPGDQIADFRRHGYWAGKALAQYVHDWASEQPDAVAVIDERGQLTVGGLEQQAARVAGSLAAAGAQPGDRVLVQMPNWQEATVAFFGVARLGAIAVLAQPTLRNTEIMSILTRTGAVAAIVPGEFRGFDYVRMYKDLAAEVPALRSVFVAGDDPGPFATFASMQEAESYAGPYPDPDRPAAIIFTSGTTSAPKACVHTSNTLAYSGENTLKSMQIVGTDVMFMPSPVLHTTGLIVGLLGPAIHRIPSVLQARWKPDEALDLIARHGCTATLGATAFGTMLLDAYDPDRHDTSRFRLFALAGAPIPADVVVRLQERVGCRVVSAYGSTEMLLATMTRPEDSVERVSTRDGIAGPGVQVKISDVDGAPLPPGNEGELRVRGPGRILCYWDDPARLPAAIDDQGFFGTGDLAYQDEAGYIRISGRMSDIINRGGHKIAPAEVEEILLQAPGIADIAIVPMPDDRLGERSCAYIVRLSGDEDITAAAISEFLDRFEIAKYKYPERVETISELPRTPTGKVERFKLVADIRQRIAAERNSSH